MGVLLFRLAPLLKNRAGASTYRQARVGLPRMAGPCESRQARRHPPRAVNFMSILPQPRLKVNRTRGECFCYLEWENNVRVTSLFKRGVPQMAPVVACIFLQAMEQKAVAIFLSKRGGRHPRTTPVGLCVLQAWGTNHHLPWRVSNHQRRWRLKPQTGIA